MRHTSITSYCGEMRAVEEGPQNDAKCQGKPRTDGGTGAWRRKLGDASLAAEGKRDEPLLWVLRALVVVTLARHCLVEDNTEN